jgi:hypothetical protein
VRQGACCNAEPLIGAAFGLAELMANHQLINLSHFVGNGDLHCVGAVPLICWDAAG